MKQLVRFYNLSPFLLDFTLQADIPYTSDSSYNCEILPGEYGEADFDINNDSEHIRTVYINTLQTASVAGFYYNNSTYYSVSSPATVQGAGSFSLPITVDDTINIFLMASTTNDAFATSNVYSQSLRAFYPTTFTSWAKYDLVDGTHDDWINKYGTGTVLLKHSSLKDFTEKFGFLNTSTNFSILQSLGNFGIGIKLGTVFQSGTFGGHSPTTSEILNNFYQLYLNAPPTIPDIADNTSTIRNMFGKISQNFTQPTPPPSSDSTSLDLSNVNWEFVFWINFIIFIGILILIVFEVHHVLKINNKIK